MAIEIIDVHSSPQIPSCDPFDLWITMPYRGAFIIFILRLVGTQEHMTQYTLLCNL